MHSRDNAWHLAQNLFFFIQYLINLKLKWLVDQFFTVKIIVLWFYSIVGMSTLLEANTYKLTLIT